MSTNAKDTPQPDHGDSVANEADTITRADGRPIPPDYLLDTRNGWFRAKVTVCTDRRLSGRRIFVPLNTRDPEAARIARDALLRALAAAGVLGRHVSPGDNFTDCPGDTDKAI